MTLTVETGAIVSGADSYVTLAAYQAYLTARGYSASGVDATDEQHLRRAFDGINRLWDYPGCPVETTQVNEWPRIIDDGYTETDSIPVEIQNAQCELAYLIKGGVDPFATESGSISEVEAGPVRVQFSGSYRSDTYVSVERALGRYAKPANGRRLLKA